MRRSLVVVALLAAGCSRASDEGEAKQWASQPPPKDVNVPANLSIELVVDGVGKSAITTATLSAIKPDFADSERKAWLIPTLVGAAAPVGSVVEAVAPTGVSVKFVHPTADGLEPVLFLTRRGEVIVSAIDPKEPFPRYHGQGGRLHRAGDSLPRVAPVARLEITHPPRP
jgi:hypothetical protein